jgi:2-oxoglutarate dehydrogenase E2 component (dihydrolipoamide succinyltransferase)
MLVDVVMPKMGESIQEGKILRWAKKVGEKIAKDETILEISTDKVDSEIPSPVGGILAAIVVAEQETVPVGTVIAKVETDASAKIESAGTPAPPAAKAEPQTSKAEPTPVAPATAALPARGDGDRFYSPLVRSIAKQEGLSSSELARIQGSGLGGRVTKQDVLGHLKHRPSSAGAPAGMPRFDATIQKMDLAELQKKYPAPRHEILQMDNIQQKMAEHMVRSIATSPHVQAIDEVDVTGLVNYRAREGAAFERREGFKLTYTPFFFAAVANALKEFPIVNSSVEGDKIILKKYLNIGMAVASPSGLIVPVLKNCEEKNFLGLARAINDIAVRTRNKKLQPDEIAGGTFTLTNYGIFGNIIGIPIINQPQVAILGTGAIKKRPVVVTDADGNDLIGIRSMMYLTLSFDHRIIDGAIGGQFLAKVKQGIEAFDFGAIG